MGFPIPIYNFTVPFREMFPLDWKLHQSGGPPNHPSPSVMKKSVPFYELKPIYGTYGDVFKKTPVYGGNSIVMGVPQNRGCFYGKTWTPELKWMRTGGTPHFWKRPYNHEPTFFHHICSPSRSWKVCRSGASATFCTACETVSQASQSQGVHSPGGKSHETRWMAKRNDGV